MTKSSNLHQHCLLLEDQESCAQFINDVMAKVFPGICIHHHSSIKTASDFLLTSKANDLTLALIDFGLPDGNGLEMIAKIRELNPCIEIVATTIFGDDEHIFSAIEKGASGYILKDDAPDLILDILKRFARGEPPLSPLVARRLLQNFKRPLEEGIIDEKVTLTPREMETLTFIASGMTVTEAAKQMGLSYFTVAGYVKLIYQKLHVSNRAEVTYEAIKRGLV